MNDFLDVEAEENEVEIINQKKKKEFKKHHPYDNEDEGDDDEDEEDDDEEKLHEEFKDLIDDNPIDEESDREDSDASENFKKRKKSDDEDLDDYLDDEDFNVIEENLGVKVKRKRFKRLRTVDSEESEEEEECEIEKERDAIANKLFEVESDEEEKGNKHNRKSAIEFDQYDSEEESDTDDFIVDDGYIAEKKVIDPALQEALDIFGTDFDYEEFDKYGEDDEKDEDASKKTNKNSVKKSIFDIYEPSELKRGYYTELDNQIRITDIPERMQLRSVPVTSATEEELAAEAKWIYVQAFQRKTISTQDAHLTQVAKERARKSPQAVAKIKIALDFIRNQHFEVPFISFYRKEYVLPELNIIDLWKVYKYDAKWCQLYQRKQAVLALFHKMKHYQEEYILKDHIDTPLPEDIRILREEDIEKLENVQTTEELYDCYHHFMLYYSHEIPKVQEAIDKQEKGKERQKRIKQAPRTGPYSICRKAGLGSLAKKFGLPPEKFAKNFNDEYQFYKIKQELSEPNVVAQQFVGKQFQTTDEVLKATQLMVAIQLAREPLIRESVRKIYREKVKISVRPTKTGIKIIDENHPIYSMKYLKDKPVKDFVGDQYLKLVIAEKDNLITISFSEQFEGSMTNNYIEQMKQLYYKDELSKVVQDWNALRVESVEMALTKMIIPDLKKELHSILLDEAKEYVLSFCARKMYNWIKIAPYKCEFSKEDEEWDTSGGIKVMGLAYSSNYLEAAFACIVTPTGKCTDYLKLPNLLRSKNSLNTFDKNMKKDDLFAIKKFLTTKKPHIVVIGGESRDALMIAEDIKECIAELVLEGNFLPINIEILDNELSLIYSNSNEGISEFKTYPEILRQAISLARRLQDPLIEFTRLCNIDNEILCLKFNPLQDQLAKEDLLDTIHQEFVNRVNEVGVDINKAIQQSYACNLIQFLCGLGPRKGKHLIRTLKQANQRLENRTQLVTVCHMGPKIFVNCSGFIKIDPSSLDDSTEADIEVLDGTRIHPQTYAWARKMASNALEYNEEECTNQGVAVEEIVESPEKLMELDLDAFVEELEKRGCGNKAFTLYDIRTELIYRYHDLRIPYQSPNQDQLFNVLTKETPGTFYIGKLVEATVVGISYKKLNSDEFDQVSPVRNDETGLWQCPLCSNHDFLELFQVWKHFDEDVCPGRAIGIKLRLDNGISGFIHVKNLSDKPIDNLKESMVIGNRILCRITNIQIDKFGFEATCKSSDLANNKDFRLDMDPYYDTEAEVKDTLAEEETKNVKQRQIYVPRTIIHPLFHNITYVQSEKLMQTMQNGEAIIRPSSKGHNHLTLTWKLTDGIHQHIDVQEEDKKNEYSLGRSLWIGDEVFEDLNEIIARYINPMAAYSSDLFDFKYYDPCVLGIKNKAEEVLREKKKENPNNIPYIVSAAKNYPGNFLLSYLPHTQCYHEYISLSPKGYIYRGYYFLEISDLFKWFKEHYRDPISGLVTPSIMMHDDTSHSNDLNQNEIECTEKQIQKFECDEELNMVTVNGLQDKNVLTRCTNDQGESRQSPQNLHTNSNQNSDSLSEDDSSLYDELMDFTIL